MRTPITYYGGKQQLASTIIEMIPAHRIYVEPFFGGGAVFFAKGKSYLEVINDINDNLVTFYEVCQDAGLFAQLYDRVQHTLLLRAYKYFEDHPDQDWIVNNAIYQYNATGSWKYRPEPSLRPLTSTTAAGGTANSAKQ